MIRLTLLQTCILVPVLLAGCGYSALGPSGLYRDDVATVAVPVALNDTGDRDTGPRLTQALVRELEARTPYRVADEATADTLLEVRIIRSNLRTLTRDRFTTLPQEQLLTITADVTWRDLRSGRVLLRRQGLDQTSPYFPTLGEGTFSATQTAAERLASGIVEEMTALW